MEDNKNIVNAAAQSSKAAIVVVMLCFFAMGFVDLVGTASNCLQKDLNLSNTLSNTMPSIVFFWFLIFSVPTSVLMNKIGRKKTVILSLLVTLLSLILPIFTENIYVMVVAFSLLGIGNALMQTSHNPLVSMLVKGNLASTLTFGQFVKAIASFLPTIIVPWATANVSMTFGLSWRIIFPLFTIIGIIATIALSVTPIKEEVDEGSDNTSVGGLFAEAFKLLGVPIVLLSFLGIMCHVGIDVGTNTIAPKLLHERLGMDLQGEALFATSVYFIARTIGCLTGSFFLRVLKTRTFFIISIVMMALSMVGMFVGTSKLMLFTAIALVGYGNSNVFSMCLSQALLSMPEKKNAVSGLMIMGLFGGTIFPLVMGLVSDGMGSQIGSVIVMSVGVIYLFSYIRQVKF